MIIIKDNEIQIQRLELGPWQTNAYIGTCLRTRRGVLIDAPSDARTIIAALGDTKLEYILLTHSHVDHVGALPQLLKELKPTLVAHVDDSKGLTSPTEIYLNDGDAILFGKVRLEAIHTPGHTPGSMSYKIGRYLFSGDTIFPGGPGRTESPQAFKQIIKSISEKIMALSDDTNIFPGHGNPAILKTEREQFNAFTSRKHIPDVCGDVLWLSI